MNKEKKKIIASTLIFFSVINFTAYGKESPKYEKNKEIINKYILGDISEVLNLGEEVTKSLGGELGDSVQFKFDTSTTGYLDLDFTSYGKNINIKVITTEGQVLFSEEVSGSEENPKIKKLKLPLEKGTYYLRVENSKPELSEKFKLTSDFRNINGFDEESNNELSTATNIKFNETVNGFLAMDDHIDFYKIIVKEPIIVTINIKSKDDFQCAMWETEWDSFRSERYEVRDNGETPIEITQGLLPGTYYLSIQKNDDRRDFYGFEYDLNLTREILEKDHIDIEPNDNVERASRIELNKNNKGFLSRADNFDYYKITIPKDMKVYMKFTAYQTLAFEYVYPNGDRSIIASTTNANEKNPYTKQITRSLKKGEHIFNVNNFWSNYGKYEFDIRTSYFNDVGGHWAEKEINEFLENGTLDKSNENFRPNDNITRAEFVKMVNKTFGFKSFGEENFSDVSSKDWFYNEVRIALKAGYISASNENFRPQDKITREEAAKIIVDIKKKRDNNLDKIQKYKDFDEISNWAKSSVEGAVEQGYMGKGSEYFRPKDGITRAESVVTLYRVNN